MALVLCPECKTQVSQRADACPRCGCPFRARTPRASRRSIVRRLLSGSLSLMMMAVLASLVIYIIRGPGPLLKVRDATIDAYETHVGEWPIQADAVDLEELGDVGRELGDRIRQATTKGGTKVEVSYPVLQKDTFFPAIYHLCGSDLKSDQFSSTFAKVEVRNETGQDLEGLTVEVELEGLSTPAREVLEVPAGTTQTVAITPTFSEEIAKITEERPGHIKLKVSLDGKVLREERRRIIVASRNDLPRSTFAYRLAAVFVTPNDPVIDEILTRARRRAGGTLRGYQGSLQDVRREVKAIYDVLAELGIGYRNAANSFMNARGLSGQKIYFPSECVQLTSANCLDGCCLFASCLEKIGLHPYFVMVPGHVFLGVELAKDAKDKMLFLETTLIGRASFEQSERAGLKSFRQARNGKSTIVSIPEVRKLGITPFPLRVAEPRLRWR